MTRQDIYNMLNEVAPTYYSQAPIGTLLPFITYITDHANNFGADNKVYKEVTGITATLYMSAEDFATEEALNAVLEDADIFWISSTDFDEDQKVYTTVYEMEVI